MPEASARIRPAPATAGRSRTPPGGKIAVAALKRLGATPPRGYAAAALTAALIGIVVNALALQHARHPAPFFVHESATAPIAPVAPAAPIAASNASAPTPPTRPVALGAPAAAAATGPVDPIGDMLRTSEREEAQKRLAAAQTLLIKLGYVVKPDGEANAATITALRDFERARGLPPSNDVSARLLKALTAAASVAGR